MNPDEYQFTAYCPTCKENRGVSCSRKQVATGEPVQVYSQTCRHTWVLTDEDSRFLRENTSVLRARA